MRETSDSLCALAEHWPLLDRGDGDDDGDKDSHIDGNCDIDGNGDGHVDGDSDWSHGDNSSFCLLLVNGALSCVPVACEWAGEDKQ